MAEKDKRKPRINFLSKAHLKVVRPAEYDKPSGSEGAQHK